MAGTTSGIGLRRIHSLWGGATSCGLSDAELLKRFLTTTGESAESAFASLVARHGAMVLGVCRRILHDSNDVEDAFQATFLVLVKKAASVRVEGSLGRWLYGVSYRIAVRAKLAATHRSGRESVAVPRADHCA